jgi:hypothetical protein
LDPIGLRSLFDGIEKSQIAAAIDGHGFAFGITRDEKTSLLQSHGTGQAELGNRSQEKE